MSKVSIVEQFLCDTCKTVATYESEAMRTWTSVTITKHFFYHGYTHPDQRYDACSAACRVALFKKLGHEEFNLDELRQAAHVAQPNLVADHAKTIETLKAEHYAALLELQKKVQSLESRLLVRTELRDALIEVTRRG